MRTDRQTDLIPGTPWPGPWASPFLVPAKEDDVSRDGNTHTAAPPRQVAMGLLLWVLWVLWVL